jgi:hypothetical protein
LLKISFSRLLGGGILVELKMDSFLLLFIFRWLIHVSTLSNPWLYQNLKYFELNNKIAICMAMLPFSKKNIIQLSSLGLVIQNWSSACSATFPWVPQMTHGFVSSLFWRHLCSGWHVVPAKPHPSKLSPRDRRCNSGEKP